jgi:UDP-glucose 4-epimerase
MAKKIIVTGGTGFIGSHTVVELQQTGYDVIIIDNLSNSYEWVLDSIEQISGVRPEFYNIDLCNKEALSKFFVLNSDIAGIIHFAAFKAVGESVQNPMKYYRNNIISLINLLECIDKTTIDNVVFSSSCTVYGQPDILPVREDTPFKTPYSPYGYTKQVAEKILQDFSVSSGKKICSLRYFNPIGAHKSSLIGELPIGIPSNLVPYITQTAIGKREQLNIWGNDYETPDGTCIRDYIHVVDLAKAHISALRRMIDAKNKNKFETFNIGTGNGFSVLEVVKSFEKMSGVKLNYKFSPRRDGDIVKIWADTTLANTELGWHAELDLDQMMLSAWNWERRIKEQKLHI